MPSLNTPQYALLVFAGLMLLAMGAVYAASLFDARTLRGVGIWRKPLKFMASMALFAATTVWLAWVGLATRATREMSDVSEVHC